MPVLTESPTLGDLLKFELNGNYTRETVTLKSGTEYALGSVLGRITASGKYRLSPAAEVVGDEGAETAVAVLIEAVDATAADATGLILARGPAIVSKAALVFDASVEQAAVSPEFFDKLIGHSKVEEAYKYFSSTGAQPLREDTRRRFPFAGIVFEEYNATVTLSTGTTVTLIPAGEGIAFPLGTLDTFVTHGAPANLIETVNTVGLPIYARQISRPDGSAIEVKTEASILPINKRPRLAVRIFSSN